MAANDGPARIEDFRAKVNTQQHSRSNDVSWIGALLAPFQGYLAQVVEDVRMPLVRWINDVITITVAVVVLAGSCTATWFTHEYLFPSDFSNAVHELYLEHRGEEAQAFAELPTTCANIRGTKTACISLIGTLQEKAKP